MADFPYLFDKEPTPGDIFPSIMNPIHGNVCNIVASPFWEGVGEGDPFAVTLHQVCVVSFWSGCDLNVPGEWNLVVLGIQVSIISLSIAT